MPHAALQKQDQKSSFQVKPRRMEMESRASRRPQSPVVNHHRNIGNMAVQRLVEDQDQLQDAKVRRDTGREAKGGLAQLYYFSNDYRYQRHNNAMPLKTLTDTGVSIVRLVHGTYKTNPPYYQKLPDTVQRCVVIQKQTDVEYQGQVRGWQYINVVGVISNRNVGAHGLKIGSHTTAYLDPGDMREGTAPNIGNITEPYNNWGAGFPGLGGLPALNFIRGHLLNHKLGGKGEWYNIFPMTPGMNNKFSKRVETPTKEKLLELNELRAAGGGVGPNYTNRRVILDVQVIMPVGRLAYADAWTGGWPLDTLVGYTQNILGNTVLDATLPHRRLRIDANTPSATTALTNLNMGNPTSHAHTIPYTAYLANPVIGLNDTRYDVRYNGPGAPAGVQGHVTMPNNHTQYLTGFVGGPLTHLAGMNVQL